MGLALGALASLLMGIGVFCFAAISESLEIAALAGTGALCIALALILCIWVLAKSDAQW